MVKHIVMFRLRGTEAERKELANRFKNALEQLPARIPELKALETGANCNPNESWDVVLTAICNNFEDLGKYSAHPDHLAAVKIIKENIDQRACVDYEF